MERTYGCSGTLIAPKYLITDGHCVHSLEEGGWTVRVEAVPGYENGYRPYGSAFATRLRSVIGWTSFQDRRHDWALVTLDRKIGSTLGWFGYGAFSDATLGANSTSLASSPGDKCGGHCLDYDADPFSRLTSLTLTTHYRTDTFNGQSGSGVSVVQDCSRYVVAAHRGTCSAGDRTADCGPRITAERFSRIRGWIASGL